MLCMPKSTLRFLVITHRHHIPGLPLAGCRRRLLGPSLRILSGFTGHHELKFEFHTGS